MANNIRGHTASYICALADDGSNQILPAEIDPATGELKVQATFTGVLVVAIDEATDSIQITEAEPIALFIPIAMGEFAPPQSMTKIPHM
jgi:hypothetical protein